MKCYDPSLVNCFSSIPAAYAAAVLFCLSEEKHLDRFPSGEIPGATVYRNEVLKHQFLY